MAKINSMDDFKTLTSNITSFSHAYLFDTNSLLDAYPYVLEFAKKIICDNQEDDEKYSDVCYQIDKNEYDDLYVVNPTTIGINTEEIEKLLSYMETKSLRDNGRRVYIIYGFERLTRDTSNKILKFLEEPSDNIYALLMTENIDKILSTIISRCQTLKLSFDVTKTSDDKIILMEDFLKCLLARKNKTISYVLDYFGDAIGNRPLFYEYFEIIEKILSDKINYQYGIDNNHVDVLAFDGYDIMTIINVLDITNKLKSLIKQNINLNLLLDRYIIEVTKELDSCKK